MPTVARTGICVYDLGYQRIGNPAIYPGDAVLVTATGPNPRYCRTWSWNSYSFPLKLRILIYCFDSSGHPADAALGLAYLRS